ncbi:MAG: ABC transporter permease, partial [Ktedonobacterales bacterium]
MSQIHIPVTTPVRAAVSRTAGQVYRRWVDIAVIVAFVAVAYGIVMAASRWATPLTPSTQIDLSPRALPYYAGLSTLRMAVAYI